MYLQKGIFELLIVIVTTSIGFTTVHGSSNAKDSVVEKVIEHTFYTILSL